NLLFLTTLVLLSNAANIANIMNLVTYLRGTMHMGVAEASTTASNFFAALQMFSIPAAFLADSYIKRFYTVLIFGPIEILFDTADPVEQRQETSFFNWYTFAVSSGGFVGLVLVVWVENTTTGIPMSVFWLTVQFFLLGVVDVTSFVGLLEFFYSEASTGMKSVGSSIFYCILGVSAWLGSLLIQVANRVTRRADGTGGWLDGTNLNMGKLDNFYWLLAVLELVALFVYTFFARRYVYRNEQRVVDVDTKVPTEGATFGDVMI
uniref:Major facilitator superfamily (MFS) profile domain-containing protein n=1 Tax=Aegilops tauschii subsp. strangulata TaxID=200361 RepID=A0A453BPA3_AEGTS